VELASAVTLVLVVLFQVITAPVVLAAGRRRGLPQRGVPEDTLVVDELAAARPADAVDG
jgi:multisubunit Na+/H+ antiporter MnhG subunit